MTESLEPMDVLMGIMNDKYQPIELRLQAAVALMPYFHIPLSPIEPEGE